MDPDNNTHRWLDFDLDRYLNLYIPHNRVHLLPQPLRHILGHRRDPKAEPLVVLQWLLTFVATLAGLCLVSSINVYAPGVAKYHPPVIIASFGASAVLQYNTLRSPLAQPRNSILGQTLSAIIGVCVAKLFQLNPHLFANYSWLAGAVGCACASWVMSVTNTIHPPGGATAILASTEVQVVALGWMFVPVVMLGSVLMVVVALLFNNTIRHYPSYWWTPEDVGRKLQATRRAEADPELEYGLEKQTSSANSERTLRRALTNVDFVEGLGDIHILAYKIVMPSHIDLAQDEMDLLEKLQERIRTHDEVGG